MANKVFNIDSTHSTIGFKVKHMMFSKVRGQFDTYTSSVDLGENFEDSKLKFEADVNSINTNNADRDKHLKSTDFFNADSNNGIKFESTKITKTGDQTYLVEGDLAFNGISKPIQLEAEYSGVMKDPWGQDRLALVMKSKINREDWKMTFNQALETGGVLVGKEVELEIESQFV